MKQFITYLLLGALLGVIPPPVPAQQNRSSQHTAQEIQALKNRISELEKQRQTVENVEKLELQAKLAEANAKLVNSEFGKFERGLKDSNDEWLRGWSSWFLGVIGVFVAILIGVGAVFWFWLKSQASRLIADTVEKNLKGFKDAVNQVGVLKDQLRILEKEHATATLEDCINHTLWFKDNHPEQIKGLGEEALLDVIGDKGRIQAIRYKAAEVLAARRSPRLIPPTLEILNSVLDSNDDLDFETRYTLRNLIIFLEKMCSPEAYHGLRKLLNRMIEASEIHKDAFLMVTVLAFGGVGIELNMRDSVSILKSVMPHFQHPGYEDLNILVGYFDRFNDSSGIKDILTKHVTNGMPEVEKTCLDLLEKHDSKFVEEWRAQKAADGTES